MLTMPETRTQSPYTVNRPIWTGVNYSTHLCRVRIITSITIYCYGKGKHITTYGGNNASSKSTICRH